ncbi:MAG TPA: aminoglycoside phosphotransferase family protein [Acidimicrobiia bacterium]|nr:aminoglycoside phosphotransferase family protein [Acidimicrobiia bacterium]
MTALAPGTPPAEVDVDAELVRRLLVAQHPDLADLPLSPVANGWDNAMFRLGDDLAVRLPRRALAAPLAEVEQRWLPDVAVGLPLAVPAPVRTGEPGEGFPWRWSVVPWIPGRSADEAAVSPSEAAVMGALLGAVHRPAPPGAPRNPYRGVPLADRADTMAERLERLDGVPGFDRAGVERAWDAAVAEPLHEGVPVWIHGDLHPRNVLADGGRLTGVVDWGDMCGGDPATDLACAWMLFPVEAHGAFRDAYGGIDDVTWARARGWAVFFAVVLLDTGRIDDLAFETVARTTLRRLEV